MVREVERNAALPTLKRARLSLSEYGHINHEALVTHEQIPVLRNYREEDTAAKRLKLSEPDDAENIVITDDRLEDAEEARVFLEREDNGSELKVCESCGEGMFALVCQAH